jgi:hypothetical protein
VPEVQCIDKRVALTFIVAYSTSMNAVWGNETRWTQLEQSLHGLSVNTQAALEDDAIISLIRYAHDPSPNPGTTIPNDTSGIVDGKGYDVMWSDCNWADVLDAYADAGPPLDGAPFGAGSWVKGSMDLALAEITAAKLQPANAGRAYRVIVIAPGNWSGQDGTVAYSPPSSNPSITATELYQTHNVPTYVVALNPDGTQENAADQLAAAGGTNTAYVAFTGNALPAALTSAITAAIGNESCD